MQASTLTAQAPQSLTEKQTARAWLITGGVTLSALVVVLTVLMWGLNRGLDPDAESFYLLSFQNPSAYPTFSSFHLLLAKLPKLVTSEIMHYRYLEVLARLVPSCLLGCAFLNWAQPWLKLDKARSLFVVAFGCLGASVVFSSFPRTISYNGLSSALVILSAAFVFLGTSKVNLPSARIVKPLLLGICGILAGLAFFVKFTSAIFLLTAALLFMFAQRCSTKDFVALLSGVVAGVCAFFGIVQSPGLWWNIFSDAVRLESGTDHNLQILMSGGASFFGRHWWQALLLLGIGFGGLRTLSSAPEIKQRALIRRLCVVGSMLILLAACALIAKPSYFRGREALVTITTLGCFVTALISGHPKLNVFLAGAVFLFLLPLIAALGTNCWFFAHAASNMAPWFILVAVSALACAVKFRTPYTVACVPIALAFFCTIQFIVEYIYQRDDSLVLTKQTASSMEVPLLKGVQLEDKYVKFYDGTRRILIHKGFQTGDLLLTLYDLPALAYLMQAVSPGQAWYISWPQRDAINAHYLGKSDLTHATRFFLALTGEKPNEIIGPAMLRALKDQNRPFPESFELIGTLPSPVYPGEKVFFYASNPLPR